MSSKVQAEKRIGKAIAQKKVPCLKTERIKQLKQNNLSLNLT